MSGGMCTPWGVAHENWQLDDGVFLVQTAEHGGLLIDQKKAQEILSDRACTLGQHWYDFLVFEQEKEMMVVFYEHPELYPWMEEELTAGLAEDLLHADMAEYFASLSSQC